jgi:hypothetical protein
MKIAFAGVGIPIYFTEFLIFLIALYLANLTAPNKTGKELSIIKGIKLIVLSSQYQTNNKNDGTISYGNDIYLTGEVGDYPVNVKDILIDMGILINGDYRENVLNNGVYLYCESNDCTTFSVMGQMYRLNPTLYG